MWVCFGFGYLAVKCNLHFWVKHPDLGRAGYLREGGPEWVVHCARSCCKVKARKRAKSEKGLWLNPPASSLSEPEQVVSISMCWCFLKIQSELTPKLDSQYWHPRLKEQLRWLEDLSRTKISRLSSSISSMDSTPFSYHWAMPSSWDETRKGKSKTDRWAHLLWKLLQCAWVGWRIHGLETVMGRAWVHSQCQVMCLPEADASPHPGTIRPFHIKQLWDEIDGWLLKILDDMLPIL